MKDLYDDINAENKNAYVDSELKGIAEMSKGVYLTNTDSFSTKKVVKKVKHPMFRGVTQKELKRGIIFSEILGKPKGL